MTHFFKQPLLHFLLLGGIFFFIYTFMNSDGNQSDNRSIVIDNEAILTFMQYKAKSFDRPRFEAKFNQMSTEQKIKIGQSLAREEVMYREALALNLDENDYVIRNRLIQKLQFINKAYAQENIELTKQQVESYYIKHQQNYFSPAIVSFSHVFFSNKTKNTKDEIQSLLNQLQQRNAGADKATQYGDRFPYFSHYIERNENYITNHFGSKMSEQLFNYHGLKNTWFGPLHSDQGMHLVIVTKFIAQKQPDLSQIYDQVLSDAMREENALAIDQNNDKLLEHYNIDYRFEALTTENNVKSSKN